MKVRINISLDPDTIRAAKLLAAINHTTVSQLITNLVWEEADKEIAENFKPIKL